MIYVLLALLFEYVALADLSVNKPTVGATPVAVIFTLTNLTPSGRLSHLPYHVTHLQRDLSPWPGSVVGSEVTERPHRSLLVLPQSRGPYCHTLKPHPD